MLPWHAIIFSLSPCSQDNFPRCSAEWICEAIVLLIKSRWYHMNLISFDAMQKKKSLMLSFSRCWFSISLFNSYQVTHMHFFLSIILQELKESFNYGLFCPPSNGKAGKFLDEERRLGDYPFNGPVGYLEVRT